VARIGLPRFGIREKWWDALGAVGTVLASAPRTGEVLDAGADFYSPILPWLHHYGYRRLRGCNLVFREPMARGRIRYEHGDVTATGYRDGQFSAVTCMSVIEHGVDPDRFFAEMARILRDGAPLVVSTDYWETPIDSGGKTEFGVPVKIFSSGEIPGLVGAAERRGLRLAGPLPDLAGRDRPIRWNDLEYTFLLLTFRKGPAR
jgi:SAM-dependent methyltransferase